MSPTISGTDITCPARTVLTLTLSTVTPPSRMLTLVYFFPIKSFLTFCSRLIVWFLTAIYIRRSSRRRSLHKCRSGSSLIFLAFCLSFCLRLLLSVSCLLTCIITSVSDTLDSDTKRKFYKYCQIASITNSKKPHFFRNLGFFNFSLRFTSIATIQAIVELR